MQVSLHSYIGFMSWGPSEGQQTIDCLDFCNRHNIVAVFFFGQSINKALGETDGEALVAYGT